MQSQEISRQLQRLEALFQRVADASREDLDLQAHWARYLCVLISGFIENAIKEIYSKYIQNSASPAVAKYAIYHILTIRNPKSEKVVELARHFKESWALELENFLGDEGCKDAIDSIMNNRHQIAHGKDIGITIARLHEYLHKVVQALEFIEGQCLK